MASSENDLLQRFIANEKKSKTWTLISVVAFCIFALGIVYLADKLNKANKIIEDQHAQLLKSLETADALNDSLTQNQVSLENMSANFNLIKREKDSLISVLKKMSETSKPIENNYIQKILRNNISYRYKVYVQYMPKYQAESKIVLSLLPKEYYAPGAEQITKFNFSSSIKYFNDDDKDEAQTLANLINTGIDKFKNKPIRIIKANNVTVSKGQLEIWLGDYAALTTTEIIKKYSVQQQQQRKL